MPLQDLELVAEHDDLDVFLESAETMNSQKVKGAPDQTKEEREGHDPRGCRRHRAWSSRRSGMCTSQAPPGGDSGDAGKYLGWSVGRRNRSRAPVTLLLSRDLVLQVLAQPGPHLVGVFMPVSGDSVLGCGGDDLVFLTRDGEGAADLAREVSTVGNFSSHWNAPSLGCLCCHISSTLRTSRLRNTIAPSHSWARRSANDAVSGRSELAMASS